ncbi:MAG: ABC transporter ATP-binding protein, partial [Chloroflexi bacterium]|nr:ABC transporter ATP-binding protein [Chloroflexota bacterium]
MQQRVSVARALAIDPQVLLMDEPFSHLDELTARSMRSELLKIWESERKTVIFVTHNAHEAVFLADRVIVLTDKPTKVREVLHIDIPRPRDYEDPAVIGLYRRSIEVVMEGGKRSL